MDEVRVKVIDLDLNDILPNRFQPRIKFSEDAIIELSESIKEHGVIQPVVVRPIGDKYEIIAGERRYKASVLAGKDTIPAIITNLNDKDSAEVALIENVQRRDLSAIEEAISYKKILDMGYLTQDQLAIKLGKSQSTVANKIRLLNLCDEVQEALMEDKISERHARSLLKLSTTEKQKMILDKIIKERLTVRKADEEIDKMNSYITDSIDEPTTNLNENAFSPFNPGFMDVEKIENQAKEINQEKAAVDFNSLLSSAPTPEIRPNRAMINQEIQTVDPFTPETEQQSSTIFEQTSSVSNNNTIPSIPTTPIIEEAPNFEMPQTFSPNMQLVDNIVTPVEPTTEVEETPTVDPIVPVPVVSPIELISAKEEPTVMGQTIEPIVPVPVVAPVTIEPDSKSLSMADLLAPHGGNEISSTIQTVDPFTPEVVSEFPKMDMVVPVPTEEQLNMALEKQPSFPEMPVGTSYFPSTPIIDSPLPSKFLNEKTEEDSEPVGEEKIIEPEVNLEIDSATGNEITNQPAEVRPIIITDYSKQYDPILPNVPKPIEKIDFRQIINLIRDVNNTIEKCGYSIETEEYDLEDKYQVIFKINKD